MKKVKDVKEAPKEPLKESPDPPGEKKQLDPPYSGKERIRMYEWIRDRTLIRVKTSTGEIVEGFLKWNDRFAIKLVCKDEELIIPKHSIVYYVDVNKTQR